jgi:L-lysine exporter family protein LysE/ArgO
MAPIMKGCGIGLGLAVAIGPQNAFVLKQGILKNYVLTSILICILADALMIYIGVSQIGCYISSNKVLMACARWGGAAFLGYYGFKSFKAIAGDSTLKIDDSGYTPSLRETIIALLAVTFVNPYMYLDTIVFLGGIGAQFTEIERPFFMVGAMVASAIWFIALGYGARLLRPFFHNPLSWKILDGIIGVIMWAIAITLIIKL